MTKAIRLKNSYLAFDYASLKQNNTQSLNITSWSTTTLPLGTNSTFETNNSDSFSQSGSGIKCNFKGKVLVYKRISMDDVAEIDVIFNGDWFTAVSTKTNSGIKIQSVNVGDVIYLQFATGLNGNHNIYDGRITIVRIA